MSAFQKNQHPPHVHRGGTGLGRQDCCRVFRKLFSNLYSWWRACLLYVLMVWHRFGCLSTLKLRWRAGLWFVAFGFVVTYAAVDLDRLQMLAKERYGARGTEVMTKWAQMVQDGKGLTDAELLNLANTFVNRRTLYQDDPVAWGQADYWATPLETMGRGVGDCEDYAIAKYLTLLQMGIANDKLRLIYVRAKSGGGSIAHMVLGYFAQPDAEPLILDNLITSVRPAASRQDLTPVFSFNSNGLWAEGGPRGDPTARLSRWRDVIERMRQEGWSIPSSTAQ